MNWPSVYRLAHLAGGLRAESPERSQNVSVCPSFLDVPKVFVIRNFSDLYSLLISAGSTPIGVEFLNGKKDALNPSEWRPFHPSFGGWVVQNAVQKWRNLSHAAFEADDLDFLEMSQKIAFQLTACSLELKRVSDAYNQELEGVMLQGKFKDGVKFATLNTQFIFIAIHSYFVAVGTLRDYLAEFAARYPLLSILPQGKKIRLMSSLRNELKKTAHESLLIKEILSITEQDGENGWLAEISNYRDLVVHYIPLSQLRGCDFVFQKEALISNKTFPTICFPMPREPREFKQEKSMAISKGSVKDWLQTVMSSKFSVEDRDALNYAHFSLGLLARLCFQLSAFSPYKPKFLNLTEHDLIGPVRGRTG